MSKIQTCHVCVSRECCHIAQGHFPFFLPVGTLVGNIEKMCRVLMVLRLFLEEKIQFSILSFIRKCEQEWDWSDTAFIKLNTKNI